MRHLGIDYGTKKIGLALSDEAGDFAFPHSVIPADTRALSTVVALCTKESVGTIVVGRSRSYTNEENPVMHEARRFAEQLHSETALPIMYEDEVLTTQEAMRDMGKSEETDASAAAIILRSYLARTRAH